MALYRSRGYLELNPSFTLTPAKTPFLFIFRFVPSIRTRCLLNYSSISLKGKPTIRNFCVTPPQMYVYPDPIPQFAQDETQKFRTELMKELLKEEEIFGCDLVTVVEVCAEIFSEFLHKDYGGPGTLLVEPFTEMLIVLKQSKLPGATVAARASLLWAQNYVDHDWEIWISKLPN